MAASRNRWASTTGIRGIRECNLFYKAWYIKVGINKAYFVYEKLLLQEFVYFCLRQDA